MRSAALLATVTLFVVSAPGGDPARGGDPAPGPGRSCLRIEYRTTGILPGSGREGKGDERVSTVTQRITIDDASPRLLYEEAPEGAPGGGKDGKRIIFRADGPRPIVYEILDGKKYREHSGDLNEIQKERRITEENEILAALQLPRKERQAFFKENPHLSPDRGRDVQLSREPGERVLERDCERVRVTENGRVIVDGLVTRQPIGSGSPFQLYRRLGAFSDEVLLRLASVEGLLLRGKITMVTALRANELEVEAKAIEQVIVPADLFEVTGLTRVEETPEVVQCGWCGKPVVTKNPGGKGFYDGTFVYFCREECQAEYDDVRLKGKK